VGFGNYNFSCIATCFAFPYCSLAPTRAECGIKPHSQSWSPNHGNGGKTARRAHAQTACVSHITLSEAEQCEIWHILGMMDVAVTGDGASRCPKSGSWALRASRGSTLAGTTRGPSPCLCRASVWTGRAGRPAIGLAGGHSHWGRSTSVMQCNAMHHASHSYLSLCPLPFPLQACTMITCFKCWLAGRRAALHAIKVKGK
jgi:hypothetical protein